MKPQWWNIEPEAPQGPTVIEICNDAYDPQRVRREVVATRAEAEARCARINDWQRCQTRGNHATIVGPAIELSR